jgi:hypothetical protein
LLRARVQSNRGCWEGAYTFDRCCDLEVGRTGDPACWCVAAVASFLAGPCWLGSTYVASVLVKKC